MDRALRRSLSLATLAGLTNLIVIVALLAWFDHPTVALSPEPRLAAVVATAFLVGFAPAFLAVHTRLLAPALAYVAIFGGFLLLEVTSPGADWVGVAVELHAPSDVPPLSYAREGVLWYSLFAAVAAVEFVLRGGYGLGGNRLRNLPRFPLPRPMVAILVTGLSLAYSLHVYALTASAFLPLRKQLVAIAAVTTVAAVSLTAFLSWGLLAPPGLGACYLPLPIVGRMLGVPAVLLRGDTALAFALLLVSIAIVEDDLRRRFAPRDRPRFATGSDSG